jgi:fibronectin-binding autotransporter adhesin
VALTTPYALSNAVLNAQGTGTSSNLVWSGISSITLGGLSGAGNIPLGANQLLIGNNNSSTEYSGALSGTGSLAMIGSGTFTLSGANTYSGTTTISNGTLQIGNGGATGTVGPNNIVNNSELVFNRSNPVGYGGIISGAGDLTQAAGGTLTLSNASTYTGDTLIESGTLALTGVGAIANAASIQISAGAVFDVSGTTGGAMTLTGGIISGDGAVNGGFTIGNGATLAPGTFIGTLTFSNALTLAPGSISSFGISKLPTANDVAKVFGALTCGGTLQVNNLSGNPLAANDSFKLFDAASYSGAFASVTLPPLPAGLGWNTNSLNTNGTISVVIATVPVISPVSVSSNGGLVFTGTGGVADADFYLLTSTNIAAPMTNWTPVLTNQFDDNGNFNFTNPIDPNSPQNYYLLQLP